MYSANRDRILILVKEGKSSKVISIYTAWSKLQLRYYTGCSKNMFYLKGGIH